MKLLIASDIHGDAVCCRAMLDAFKRENAEKILILGDILYHGPRNDLPEGYAPKKVIEMLNAVADKLICVRGNCEAEVDQMVLSFPVMSTTACVLDAENNRSIYMSHGHVYSPDNLPPMPEGSIFLSGHTHVLMAENKGDILCVNPGSVSLPKNNNPKTYAIYDGKSIDIKTLSGETVKKTDL